MPVYRSRIFSPIADPFEKLNPSSGILDLRDGFIDVENGKIIAVGSASELSEERRKGAISFGPDTLITPAFIDTHLHAPQLEMIGSYGGHLLEWLNRYTFPTERKFADLQHARKVAAELFEELRVNGTLTALMFSTIHTAATEAFFEEAERTGFRAIIGKTLMDRNAPEWLMQDAETAYEESRALLLKWHGRGLLRYAVSPRLAPTSSPQLLEHAGMLKAEFPDVYVQTHVSENQLEVQWVRELFPDAKHYVEVYDRYGLLGERTVLAHGVHLSDPELEVLHARNARLSHCPNSNLFLGSGLFPYRHVRDRGVAIVLGTDVGAGTSFSLLRTLSEAYKVLQLQGERLSVHHGLYWATLGGATALGLEQVVGNFEAGKDADFVVLDFESTPLLRLRSSEATDLDERLFALMMLGDDRTVHATYLAGELAYSAPSDRA